MKKRVIVATRGSQLALGQTKQVVAQIAKHYPDWVFEYKVIKTRGDIGNLSQPGAFIKELEIALLQKKADVAIHSYKDLPTQVARGLEIIAIPKRADARDVLIASKSVNQISDLPIGAKVGTGSPRRIHQIKAYRPDISIVPIRGNIDTRMQMVVDSKLDAVVLAAAGLHRLGKENYISAYLNETDFIPAPAQGALAIQVRQEDSFLSQHIQIIDHAKTRQAVNIERKVLEGIGGGCQLPIGSYVHLSEEMFQMHAFFGKNKNGTLNKKYISGFIKDIDKMSNDLVKSLIETNVLCL